MADNTIDTLQIQISSNANKAIQAIGSLQQKLGGLNTALESLNTSGLSGLASGVSQLSHAMSAFKNGDIKTADFTRIANGLNKLSAVDVLGISNASRSISTLTSNLSQVSAINFDAAGIANLTNSIAQLGRKTVTQATSNIPLLTQSIAGLVNGLNGLGAIKFDVTGLSTLTSSISRLGGKAATNAVPNIRELGLALKQLMATLSTAPTVNQNIINMTNALANLASNGSKINTASKAMQNGINGYSNSLKTANKHTKSFVSQIGMFYAKFFLLIRGTKSLWKSAKSAMDYIETLNYFSAAFEQVAQNAEVSDWEKYGYKSAEAYANSFETRSKQLTQKLTGFNVDKSGELTRASMPSLGLDPEKVLQYQATFAQMASSMGVASETSLKLSNALTMIGADLASVRNLEFVDVWDDMASGMVGMSRTLDKYGVNIRNVNMQQKLYELGIDKSIAKINQQDKAILRTIILLDSTKYAWGDLANTINQPANSLRLLQSNFASLARALGSLFIPIISKVLPYINALVIALQRLLSWIGNLLGIKLSGFSNSIGGAAVDMGDFADSADDSSDALEDAAKNANKLNKATRDWDELHIMSSNDENGGKDAGAGAGGAIPELNTALDKALSEYQKAWDAAYANLENRANDMADKVVSAFQRIWDTANPAREALSKLWDEGLAKLGNFSWTALKDFWNEFLVPLGSWSIGTGFPMAIDAINNFLNTIDWEGINDALRNFWEALEPFAENIGVGLITFFDDLLKVGASFINKTLPDGLNSLAISLRKIDPKTAESIGYGLGVVATALVGFKGIKSISSGIGTLATNFGKFFKIAGIAKYGAIALGISGVILALDEFGYINVDWKTLSDAFGKLAKALGKFAVGIGKGLISFIDGLLDVMSPVLETLINGAAKALDVLGNILNAIPESAISTITEILIDFFVAFQTYKAVIAVGGLISTLTDNIKLFANVLPGIVNSGPILKNLAAALGPSALGGIQFTLIAGGIFMLASAFKKFYDDATDNPELEAWADNFSKSMEKISSKSKQISDDLEGLKDDFAASGEAQSKVAEDLADKYETLHKKANPTASDIALMKQYSEDLVGYYPELEQFFNKETGLLETNREEIQKVIDKQSEMVKVKASLSGLEEAYKQQIEAQKNLTDAHEKEQEKLKEMQKQKEEWDEYLKKHPTYANTGTQGLFEGDPFGIEATRILNAGIELGKLHDIEVEALKNAEEAYEKSGETIKYFADEYDKSAKQVYDVTPDFIKSFEDVGVSITNELSRKLQDSGADSVKALEEIFTQMQTGTVQSGEQLKSVFSGIGIEIPNAFMTALENQADSTMQSQMAQMFLNLGAGAKLSAEALNEIFHSVGLELPESIISGLSEKEGTLQGQAVNLLGNIESGTALVESELKDLFYALGIDLPDELATALANSESGVQEDVIQLFSSIETGEKIKEQDLIDLFSKLGVDLPNELKDKILSQGSDIQKSTVELLTRIQSGERLKEPELKTLFSGLGISLPDELISSLESKNGDTQKQALELIGQISTATETERDSLINKLGSLGIDGANNLDAGLGSRNSELKTTTEEMANTVKDTANTALDPNDTSSNSMYNAGANASKGFWQGLKDWWNDTWLGQQIDKMKKAVTGKEGLDEHSPSKAFYQYGAFAIEGFNNGISDEMKNTFSALDNWTSKMKSFDIPSFSMGYEINRSLLDTVDVNYNTGNFNAKSITPQFVTNMSDLIDYDRLGQAVYDAQSRAMQENPVKIGDNDVFNAWRREDRRNYNMTKKPSPAGM